MATTTNNLKLVKPDYTESADIGVINRNMDIIDEAYSNIGIVNTAIGEYISVYDSLEKPLQGLNVYGESTQNGTPTPDNPIDVDFVGKYYKGALLQGFYNSSTGVFSSNNNALCSKNTIPCKEGDSIKVTYLDAMEQIRIHYYNNGEYLTYGIAYNSTELTHIAPKNATEFHIVIATGSAIPIANAKHICVTINGMYALIVKCKNKNLIQSVAYTTSANGITFTKNNNESVSISGVASAQTYIAICQKMPIPKGKYILSGCPSGGTSTTYRLQGTLYENNTTSHFDYGNGVEFEVASDSATITVQLLVFSGATVNHTFYPMIRPLGTDDTYEPYTEQTLTVATDGLCGIGEVKDYIDFEKGVKVQRINKLIIDENSNINSSIYQGYNRFSVVIPSEYASISPFDKGLCTHLKYSKDVLLASTEDNTISVYTTGTIVVTYFRMDKFTTVDELKTWLASNPMEVYYELATPIETPLTQAEIEAYKALHTNYPATTITSDSVATIECEYMADVKNYIDCKINQLATAILQV